MKLLHLFVGHLNSLEDGQQTRQRQHLSQVLGKVVFCEVLWCFLMKQEIKYINYFGEVVLPNCNGSKKLLDTTQPKSPMYGNMLPILSITLRATPNAIYCTACAAPAILSIVLHAPPILSIALALPHTKSSCCCQESPIRTPQCMDARHCDNQQPYMHIMQTRFNLI